MATSEERGGLPPTRYHESAGEQARIGNLMDMVPAPLGSVLDIGSRLGYITKQLALRASSVTALDLERPVIDDPRVTCVQGDATALPYANGSFDFVLCAEVLEHIPSPALEQACAEIARVSRCWALIGVPFRQDTRLWRTTCRACGCVSPPWAHVSRFDEARLATLFPGMHPVRQSLVGQAEPQTNTLSAWLMNVAGNPYGTYIQDEGCVQCGAQLTAPTTRSLKQRVFAKAALSIRSVLNLGRAPHANWIHLLLCKNP